MMDNLGAVIFVFILGFGWGAATMTIPILRRLKLVMDWQVEIISILKRVANTQKDELDTLRRIDGDCGRVISGTNGVIDGLNKVVKAMEKDIMGAQGDE